MPLYEYYCAPCNASFEVLRPMSRSTDYAACPECGGDSKKAISVFAAFTTGNGGTVALGGAGGCAGCASGACASCGISG
jgi:putative FmdB family regulatory protein